MNQIDPKYVLAYLQWKMHHGYMRPLCIYRWSFWAWYVDFPVQWRHNGRDGVSDHQSHDCSFKCLFRRRWKKTSKLRVTDLCDGYSPVTGEFPAQRDSNAENVSIWWRHHIIYLCRHFYQICTRDDIYWINASSRNWFMNTNDGLMICWIIILSFAFYVS